VVKCLGSYAHDILFTRSKPVLVGDNRVALLPYVHRMSANGAGVVQLALGDDASWSSGHDQIVYAAPVPAGVGSRYKIFVMEPDGTGQTQLTFGTATNDRSPVLSPDGTKIAFVSGVVGEDPQIWVMNADGSNAVELTHTHGARPGQRADLDPSWSPDGTNIAFSSDRTSPRGIYVMKADGSGPTRVSDNAALAARHPSWRGIGALIAYDVRDESDCGIHFTLAEVGYANLPSTLLVQWNLGGLTHCEMPRWSPDGKGFVMTSTDPTTLLPSIYRVTKWGWAIKQLTVAQSAFDGDHDTAWR
jgi:Tol biopolymer transport system component